MPVHKQCPTPQQPSEPILGTSLYADRCKMMRGDRCKGDGVTRGSCYHYCAICSECYSLCEHCGQPFTVDNPRDGFPLIVLHTEPSGRIRASSPLFREFLTEGDSVEEILANCQSALKLTYLYYKEENRPFPNVP